MKKIKKNQKSQSYNIFLYVWKFNPIVLELDFSADKFLFSLDGIWIHTIDTLQHQSLSLMSSDLHLSPTSVILKYSFNSQSIYISHANTLYRITIQCVAPLFKNRDWLPSQCSADNNDLHDGKTSRTWIEHLKYTTGYNISVIPVRHWLRLLTLYVITTLFIKCWNYAKYCTETKTWNIFTIHDIKNKWYISLGSSLSWSYCSWIYNYLCKSAYYH